MRLSQFILDNLEFILQDWEEFARSLQTGKNLNIKELRNDAGRMLRFIAADMETEQSRNQEFVKATGHAPPLASGELSAAHDHGVARAVSRFSLIELVSEYRALRASVTRRWMAATPLSEETVAQLIRFKEAIDQILAEGVSKFTDTIDRDSDLFTAAVGHDLSNPVNAVALSAHALATSRNLSDQERVLVQRIAQSTDRMTGLLSDLRDFTRTRLVGLLQVGHERCDVREVIRNVVDELRIVHPDRRISDESSGDVVIWADTRRIGRLVSNLVANALQHATSEVEITARGDNDWVVIGVHNTGHVIPSARLGTLFEPLVAPSMPREAPRLGLGLYIAQQIARAHAGSIEVSSTESSGTRFTVSLPRGRPPSPAAETRTP